jgi:hypothetical protein
MDSIKDSVCRSKGYALIIIACLIAAVLTHRDLRNEPHASRVDVPAPAQTQERTP